MIFQKGIDRIPNHLKERSAEKKSEGYALEKGDLSSMIFFSADYHPAHCPGHLADHGGNRRTLIRKTKTKNGEGNITSLPRFCAVFSLCPARSLSSNRPGHDEIDAHGGVFKAHHVHFPVFFKRGFHVLDPHGQMNLLSPRL